MVDSQRGLGRRTVPGTMLFAGFLERNGISNEAAAKALGVSRVTVGQWACGDKRPVGQNRKNVAIWTGGEVSEDSWNDPRESIKLVEPWSKSASDTGAHRAIPDAPASGSTLHDLDKASGE